jgi:pimeloyl-ACP methyl ester carboxylesterase
MATGLKQRINMMSLQGQKIQINDINLNVVMEGSGPAVLLLHGFPDSAYLWRNQIPAFVAAGYQVIVPDQRGFGDSDQPEGKEQYVLDKIVADAVALLDVVGVDKARVVGHDFGAIVGWLLAATRPDRVDRYAALSVGHPAAYRGASIRQKELGWYALAFQFEGLSEELFMAEDWCLFRELGRDHPEIGHWIKDLSRPGRFTAGLNWYRANYVPLMISLPALPPIQVPVMGVWSTGDFALTEEQMISSAQYVQAPWRYERLENVGHWIPLDAPTPLNDLLIEYLA